MPDEKELQTLLRLKRHEQPPPGYFDSFLDELHRRQRTEMLRQPLWRIAADRVSAFLSEHSLPSYAYATATAAVLAVGAIVSFGILKTGNPAAAIAQSDEAIIGRTPARKHVTLASHPSTMIDEISPASMRLRSTAQPRYIMDARPVSYEPAFNF